MTDTSLSLDRSYTDRLGRTVCDSSDPWLERWKATLISCQSGPLLELGCGAGRDTRFLTALGREVIAGDYSQEALVLCRRAAPLADVRLIDLREPLPFPDGGFPVVLASLCLHFFAWSMTVAMVAEIRRCLSPGGMLLLRVNSSRDLRLAAGDLCQIEPDLYLMKGELKRFFDRDTLERLLGSAWEIHSLVELKVDRYGAPKYLWEAVLRKIEYCVS
jgi:SAM-dependent methyltransferase